MSKSLTMKDIAKLAGVSQPTVSRVINGNKDVNEDIARKVMKIIEEVGYIPNKSAQTLKHSSSKLIGISVSEMNNPYFVELIDHIELSARKHGYNIIFHNAKHNPIIEWENMQNFMMRQIDGCIFVPTGEYNLQRISQLPFPVVAITQGVSLMDSVEIDHIKAGKIAAQSFLRNGHSTFGYIGKGASDDQKYIGFASELYTLGTANNKAHIIELPGSSSNNLIVRKAIEDFWELHGSFPFTAVFTENDIIALELMKLAEEKGIKVPDQLSIIGFDDTYLSQMLGISSIHQPIEDMVNMTMEMIINRIEGDVASSRVNIQLDPTLIERQSSKYKIV